MEGMMMFEQRFSQIFIDNKDPKKDPFRPSFRFSSSLFDVQEESDEIGSEYEVNEKKFSIRTMEITPMTTKMVGPVPASLL